MSLTNRKKEADNPEFEVLPGGRTAAVGFSDRAAEEETEIDLVEVGWLLLEKLHYIVLCFLIGAVLFNAYAYFLVKPTYEATAKMYVVSASKDSVVDISDLNIGTSLTSDYEQLMLSYPVLEQVIDKLKLDMDYEELSEMIVLENPDDTRILNITVTSTEPEQARDIANTLMDVSIDYLPKTMSTNAPNEAQEAKTPDKKAGPSYAKFTLIGAFIGAFLCCAYILVKYMMDDTIHTAEDMEKYFDIVPLAVIPDVSGLLNEDTGKAKTADKNRKSVFRKGKQ